jgi:hypothetical protein
MDPDPGGPKTCGSSGSGSGTLIETKAQKGPISKLRIETKPKCFDVFQNRKQNVSTYSKNFGTKPKLFDVFQLFFAKAKLFYFFQKFWNKTRTF